MPDPSPYATTVMLSWVKTMTIKWKVVHHLSYVTGLPHISINETRLTSKLTNKNNAYYGKSALT